MRMAHIFFLFQLLDGEQLDSLCELLDEFGKRRDLLGVGWVWHRMYSDAAAAAWP